MWLIEVPLQVSGSMFVVMLLFRILVIADIIASEFSAVVGCSVFFCSSLSFVPASAVFMHCNLFVYLFIYIVLFTSCCSTISFVQHLRGNVYCPDGTINASHAVPPVIGRISVSNLSISSVISYKGCRSNNSRTKMHFPCCWHSLARQA